jgi:hypothetical protein
MNGESSSEVAPVRKWRRRIVRFVCWFAGIAVLFAFFNILFVAEVPFRLLFGWLIHAQMTLPPYLANWSVFLLPLGCLVVAAILAHRFVGWWLKAKRANVSWRFGNTLAVMAIFLCCCGAGIAMSGMIHQLAWLSGDPLVHNASFDRYRFHAYSQTKELLFALMTFQSEHGHYPDSLDELPLSKEILWLETGDSGMREHFLFLHPGETELVDEDMPLIVSPILESRHSFVVGHASGACESLPERELDRIIETRGTGQGRQTPHANE